MLKATLHRSAGPAVLLVLLAFSLALAPAADTTPQFDSIPGFEGNAGWLNGPPLTASDLHGKVVLVDFWEYTCINCLRTLPYLRTWYERYKDDGLVIVGVHTPEFGFSGESANVAAAVKQLNVTWPVVLDSKSAVWDRYKVDEWPKEYLFDQNGHLVDTVSGEGWYPQTEAKIQALLKSANPKLTFPPVMQLLAQDSYLKPGAVCYLHTPEVIIQHTRVANFAGFNDQLRDATFTDLAATHKDGEIYLKGDWRITPEAVVAVGSPDYLAMRYHAIQVVGVLAPPPGRTIRVNVTQDGQPVPKADAGSDIQYDDKGASYISVDASRAYDLVMNAKFGQHELRLAPDGNGIGVYSFAFEACEQ
jgi:thiol-disulfide isomerase/thioredoxin